MFKKSIKIWIVVAFLLSILVGGVNTFLNSKVSTKQEISSSVLLRLNQVDSLIISTADNENINLAYQNFSKVLTLYLDLIDTQNRVFIDAGLEERYSDVSKLKLYSVQNLGGNTLNVSKIFEDANDADKFQNAVIAEIKSFVDYYNSTLIETEEIVTLNDENIIQKNTELETSKNGINNYVVFISSFLGVFFISILLIYFVNRNKNDK